MAISLRKKSRSSIHVLNVEYAFGDIKDILREKLSLINDRHIRRYKYFCTFGKREDGKKIMKSIYFLRNGVVVTKLDSQELKSVCLVPESVSMYLATQGLSEEVNVQKIIENLKF